MPGSEILFPSSDDIDEAIAKAMATLRNQSAPLCSGALDLVDRIEDGIAARQAGRIIEGFNAWLGEAPAVGPGD